MRYAPCASSRRESLIPRASVGTIFTTRALSKNAHWIALIGHEYISGRATDSRTDIYMKSRHVHSKSRAALVVVRVLAIASRRRNNNPITRCKIYIREVLCELFCMCADALWIELHGSRFDVIDCDRLSCWRLRFVDWCDLWLRSLLLHSLNRD